jgi:hypothetical protein
MKLLLTYSNGLALYRYSRAGLVRMPKFGEADIASWGVDCAWSLPLILLTVVI